MSLGPIESNFLAACTSAGKPYIEARDAIVAAAGADGGATRALLERAAADRDAWRRRLVAEILLARIRHPAAHRRFNAYVRGSIPHTGPKPVPGFTSDMRANAILSLGEDAFPFSLEMLWLSRDSRNPTEIESLASALSALKDERAVAPMIELLGDAASPAPLRATAASVLGRMGHAAAVPALLAASGDRAAPEIVRQSAIHSLHFFRDPCAVDALVEILKRDDVPEGEREAAAGALVDRKDPSLHEPLVWLLSREKNEKVAAGLILAMEASATPADIPFLQDLARRGGDSVKQIVAAAVEQIERRARAKGAAP